MDPLLCLRDFYKGGKKDKVTFADNNTKVKFGDEYEFFSTTPTRFNKGDSSGPYPLGALLLYMQCSHLSSKAYLERASVVKIDKVLRMDQQVPFLPGLSVPFPRDGARCLLLFYPCEQAGRHLTERFIQYSQGARRQIECSRHTCLVYERSVLAAEYSRVFGWPA